MRAPLPSGEAARIDALKAYAVFGTDPEEAFDRITRLVARVLDVPISLISLIGDDRQWLKACVGLPEVRETDRDVAFCAHTILQDGALVVPDAAQDPRFADNPFVTGAPSIRFYLGFPLRTPDGQNVGALCAIDTKPRQPSDDDLRTIRELAALVIDEMELRKAVCALETEQKALATAVADFRHLSESIHGMVFRTAPGRGDGFEYEYVSSGSQDLLGFLPQEFTEHSLSLLRLMPPAAASSAVRSLRQATEEHRVWEWEGPVGCVDGRRKWLRGLARPEIENGEVLRWRGVFVDVTEAQEREQALAVAKAEAERAIRAKGGLLSRLVHEFRPPLAAILGASRTLSFQSKDPEIREEMARIDGAGHRLLTLVDEMLNLATVETPEAARWRVLVVEDDRAHAQLMRRLLESRPEVSLETASNCSEALSRLNVAFPDLLLLDAHLPEGAAEDLLAWVRRRPDGERVPVAVLCADSSPRGHERLFALGVDHVLPKPLNVDDFLRLTDETLAPEKVKGVA